MVFCKYGEIECAFNQNRNGARHLGYSLYLSEHACGNNYSRFTRNNEAKAGYAKLAKKYYKHDPNEHHSKHLLSAKEHPHKERYHRGEYHKFICERIYKLSEIGNKTVLSGNLSVKHIGKSRYNVYNSGNNKSPDLNIPHKNESKYKNRNE